MDLIYANSEFEDVGVLQDYYFDQCYGVDENNFECRVQQYNSAIKNDNGFETITQDFILYFEFTEYGGIIDRIEYDSKTGEVVFKGRTWHGILNSYVIQPLPGNIYRTYSGEANEVLEQMIADIGMSSLYVVDIVPPEQRTDIMIESFTVRYEKMYDALMRMLQDKKCNGKLLAYYQGGQVHLGIVIAVNYATNEEFDSSQVPFKVGYSYNNVNHLICLGSGDAEERAVIHLFMNEGEVVQPYARVDEPKQDSDYYLDESQKVITGINEIVDIFDSPNSEVITNYLPQTEKPFDWNGVYHTKYFGKYEENGKTVYKNFKLIYRDEYRLTNTQPDGWETSRGFLDHYYWDATKSAQYYRWDTEFNAWAKCNEGDEGAVQLQGQFVTVKALSGAEAYTTYEPQGGLTTIPENWSTKYSMYYRQQGSSGWVAASAIPYVTYGIGGTKENPDGNPLTQEPPNWNIDWKNFYTRSRVTPTSSYTYTAVQSVISQKFTKISNKSIGTNEWKNTWTNYYVVASDDLKKNKKITKIKGKYITAQDAVNNKQLSLLKGKTYPKYKPNVFYYLTQTESAPNFATPKQNNQGEWVAAGVFEKYNHSDPPEFVPNMYYLPTVHDIPTWQPGMYYYKEPEVKQVPTFDPNNCYYQVFDRMAMLVSEGKKKMEAMCDTSTLSVNLELESNYDVLDIVGSTNNVIGEDVNKTILRKIVKIKKGIVSIEYEVD